MMILIVWVFLCVALFWSVFCRLVHASRTTRLEVRLALQLVGLAALLGLGAALYGWRPDWVTLIIVGSIDVMQLVMSRHWSSGVPRQYIYEHHRPKRRAGDTQ